MIKLETIQKRFASKILVTAVGCWEWQACRTPQGYGKLVYKDEQLAHRQSFIWNVGPIPEGACVLHTCDNPPCVNPDHLFLGDRDVNNKDRASKNRSGNRWTGKCKRGHDLSVTGKTRKSGRYCQVCANENALKYYYEHKK